MNPFRHWTQQDNAQLMIMAADRATPEQVAAALNRTLNAVRLRALFLGASFADYSRGQIPRTPDKSLWSDADRLSEFAEVPQTLAELVVEMAAERAVDLKALRSDSRLLELIEVRHDIAIEARKLGYSLPAIGRALNRDHTTILHHVRMAA